MLLPGVAPYNLRLMRNRPTGRVRRPQSPEDPQQGFLGVRGAQGRRRGVLREGPQDEGVVHLLQDGDLRHIAARGRLLEHPDVFLRDLLPGSGEDLAGLAVHDVRGQVSVEQASAHALGRRGRTVFSVHQGRQVHHAAAVEEGEQRLVR